MNENLKTPKIRFKGFTEDWEQRKFTNFVEFFNGQTYSPTNVQENGTLVLRSSNVHNGEIKKDDTVFIDNKVVNSDNVKVGDIIVVVRNGSRNLIGKHAQIKAKMPNTVIGAFMTGIRTKNSNFVNSLLNTLIFEEEIAKNMGATINQITGYMFSNMEFKIPIDQEQIKIGELFNNIDNLITLHQRKYDKLVNIKKSMLEKMFPKNDSKIPEIRFKGFTEDWEQRKLGDIAIFKQGMQVDLLNQYSENSNDKIRFIRIVDYTQNTDDIRYISKSIARDIITENDVVIVRYGATAGFVGHGIKGVLANNMFTVNPNKYVEKNYLYTYLKQDKIYKLLNNSNGSSAMPALNFSTVKNVNIEFPKNAEQLKISNIISSIDNLITLHQRKLDKLNNFKKSMLEKMFV